MRKQQKDQLQYDYDNQSDSPDEQSDNNQPLGKMQIELTQSIVNEYQEESKDNDIAIQKQQLYGEIQQQHSNKEQAFLGLVSSVMYMVTAVAMTLINKYILSVYKFTFPNAMVLFQQVSVVLFMLLLRKLGVIKFNIILSNALKWVTPCCLFVLMLSTSGYALQYLPVPMITVFKNLGLCMTAIGDSFFFGAQHSNMIKFSILIIILGSLMAGMTDLTFTVQGYFWMITHILIQSSYVLYVRKLKNTIKLEEFEMSFYNNIISLPLFVFLCFVNKEWDGAYNFPLWNSIGFNIAWWLGGIVTMAISMSSFYAMNHAGPTAFAIVGSLNKLPLTILGFWLFDFEMDYKNQICITFTLLAGFLYSKAKLDEAKNKK